MTQLAHVDDAHIANVTPEAQFSLAPRNFQEAWDFAEMIAKSDLAPGETYKSKPANVLIAIQMGMEVGLAPMQALQSIAVIKGRPSLYGDGLLGVCRASPVCEWIKEYRVGTPGTDSDGWTCEAKRVGDPTVISNTFTIKDAKEAGLWGASPPWKQYGPTRMTKMRARGWTCRDAFADVLKGLRSAEEVLDIPDETRAAIAAAPNRREAVKLALAARAPRSVGPATVAATTSDDPLADLPFSDQKISAQHLRDFFDSLAEQNGVSPAELSAIVRECGGFKRGRMPAIAAEIRGRRRPDPEPDTAVGEVVEDAAHDDVGDCEDEVLET